MVSAKAAKDRSCLVYGLIDPRTLLIRYVGLSITGMRRPESRRLASALWAAPSGGFVFGSSALRQASVDAGRLTYNADDARYSKARSSAQMVGSPPHAPIARPRAWHGCRRRSGSVVKRAKGSEATVILGVLKVGVFAALMITGAVSLFAIVRDLRSRKIP